MKHALVLALLALGGAVIPATATHADEPPDPVPNDQALHAQLLSAARDYKRWDRADLRPNIAPAPCAPPTFKSSTPTPVRLSASADEPTHGKKLYFLYPNDDFAYEHLTSAPNKGFVIVKESWSAKVVDPPPLPVPGSLESISKTDERGRPYLDFTTHEGKVYVIDEQRDLFVMAFLGSDTPNTDQGWIYATLSPDGGTVTSAGMVPSCMGCHQAAPHHRLFGLPSR